MFDRKKEERKRTIFLILSLFFALLWLFAAVADLGEYKALLLIPGILGHLVFSVLHRNSRRAIEENCELLNLVKPSPKYSEAIWQFRQEVMERDGKDGFDGCGRLDQCETVAEWLEYVEDEESPKTCPEGMVPASQYMAVRIFDNKIVGMIDLRHHIDHPILGVWGGHIGYTVRPSERGKGFGKEMLCLCLKKARRRGLEQVLVTCDRDNLASEKTILANGGVFETEVEVEGTYIKRYWIHL